MLLPLDKSCLIRNQELSSRVACLEEEVCSLQLSSGSRTLELISGNDNKTKLYTGLPAYAVFEAIFVYLEPQLARARRECVADDIYSTKGRKRKLTLREEFLAVLMRLRLGLIVEDVADRFQISMGTFCKIFHTWIRVMAQEMKVIFPVAI